MAVVRLEPDQLREEQAATLASPRRRYGMWARMLFTAMDVLYGKQRSLAKFRVLEIIARVPYQAWEHVAYVAITHAYRKPDFAMRVFERVRESREQQDNEQYHLLILEELTHGAGGREGYIRYRVIPQILAFFYYQLAWFLFVIKPRWSYALNADFEDHAEHEYMTFVAEHSELEDQSAEHSFEAEYGRFASLADLLRQIGHDERMHKDESLQHMKEARFR